MISLAKLVCDQITLLALYNFPRPTLRNAMLPSFFSHYYYKIFFNHHKNTQIIIIIKKALIGDTLKTKTNKSVFNFCFYLFVFLCWDCNIEEHYSVWVCAHGCYEVWTWGFEGTLCDHSKLRTYRCFRNCVPELGFHNFVWELPPGRFRSEFPFLRICFLPFVAALVFQDLSDWTSVS